MYDFQFVTPQHRSSAETDKMIARHKVDMLMTLICDFLMMGHEVRGTRVDMFDATIEGWLISIADVFNNYTLPHLWDLNGLDRNLMPKDRQMAIDVAIPSKLPGSRAIS